jgi:hypothetical protein
VTNQFRALAKKYSFQHLPGGIVHDPASGCWYVNTRTRQAGPATRYNPANPAAYYSQLSPRLRLEHRQIDANGFVLPLTSVASAATPRRIVPSEVAREGVVGTHVTVNVNGTFDDDEGVRRDDLIEAAKASATNVKAIMASGAGCYNIGVVYNFLLSGEMKNGQKAEERADGGIYKKVVSFRAWPRSNINALLQKSARSVRDEMINRVDEGGDSIFYGVSHWRLLRLDISVSPVALGGRGGSDALKQLMQEEFRVSRFLCAMKRNTVLYSPPVDGGCFLHCLARHMFKGCGPMSTKGGMPAFLTSRIVSPEEYMTDGMDVPCTHDIIQAFAKANDATINVFTPSENEDEGAWLLEPLLLTSPGETRTHHVDLLYYNEHWMLILNIGRLLRGWPAEKNIPLCKHCMAVLTRGKKQNAHVCAEDATTLAIKPAKKDSVYTVSNAMFAGRLPLSLAATLELQVQPKDTHGFDDDDNDDDHQLSFTLELYSPTHAVEESLSRQLVLFRSGKTLSQLLRSLQHLAHAARSSHGVMRRYAASHPRDRMWQGEQCAACHAELTAETAVYHHDHTFGNFVAWVCQRCNKAEAMRDVVVVTRGLKGVLSLLLATSNLGVMRVSHVGEWKDPLSVNISWRETGCATRFGLRLISMEKLCNSASGYMGGETLAQDVHHLRTLIWDNLHIEPLRFMTLPQIAEAACLTLCPVPPKLQLPYTADQMRLLEHPAGGLVFATKGKFTATPRHSIVEFDITKCFGALLQEKVATDIAPEAVYFSAVVDWRAPEFADTWVACVADTKNAVGLANVPLPERIEAGLPVPREVLLALEQCGVCITPLYYYRVTYDQTHTPLINALSDMHDTCKAAGDKAGAQVAKAMMVTAYGKLAQNDRAWPSQQLVRSERDTRLGPRQLLPSLRVELVKEASHELLNNTWEIEPILSTYPREESYAGRRDVRVLCVENLRQRLAAHPGIIVLRVFYRSYLVIECERHTLDEFIDANNLSHAVVVEQRSDMGVEVITRAAARAKVASRPVYAGQDIAMRSWAKLFYFLAAAVKRFGAGNVVVIRIMVDCMSLYVRHPLGVDVSHAIKQLDVTGDGHTLGTWKDEFENEHIDTWFQLNKTGYEVRYSSLVDGSSNTKRRLGGIPKKDRDALPPCTFDSLITGKEKIQVNTSRGIVTLSL